MTTDVFEQLADQLNALPNGFPRLPSGVEVQLLRKIFTREQAEIAAALRREIQSPAQIAAQLGRDEKEVAAILKDMARAESGLARSRCQRVGLPPGALCRRHL